MIQSLELEGKPKMSCVKLSIVTIFKPGSGQTMEPRISLRKGNKNDT